MCKKVLFKLLNKAIKKDCVPVSAIVIKNQKIIAKGYNLKEKTNNPLDHAEIIAIKKASKKLKTWKLNDCELYVTMKPCKMCEDIIKETRIKKVYFLCDNKKERQANKIIKFVKIDDYESENKYIDILKNFFKIKRK